MDGQAACDVGFERALRNAEMVRNVDIVQVRAFPLTPRNTRPPLHGSVRSFAATARLQDSSACGGIQDSSACGGIHDCDKPLGIDVAHQLQCWPRITEIAFE